MLAVREIWRYPVKSMTGELLESTRVTENGIVGDRAWGVRDLATGMILTGRREPRLLMASARLVDGQPVIEVDGGRPLTTSAELSTWLDRPVELVVAGALPGPLDIDGEDDWMSWQGPTGSYHDLHSTLSIVSVGSLDDFEPARFRINLIVDGRRELDLVGRDVTIGSVGLTVHSPIQRCVMVARAQPGIAADLGVLKRVIRERNNIMGVGARAYRDGVLSVGDQVVPVPE
jgi:uncharacterized protein YcbX